jgi:hypothetical protein
MPEGLPLWMRIATNLPYPLVALWIAWFFFTPAQLAYLFRKNPGAHQLSKTGELMNFREVLAVGCVAGFILLTFITAFCSYITLNIAHLL